MIAIPSRDWSVFKQIFADHWEPFQRAHPRYQTAYYDDLVAKMLDCGNPEKMGYLDNAYRQDGYGDSPRHPRRRPRSTAPGSPPRSALQTRSGHALQG